MTSFASDPPQRPRGIERIPPANWTRRQLLRRIGFGSLGLGLPTLLQNEARAANRRLPARAKSCIMIFLFGGPSQLETWDMKPLAPAEYRGEFQPIATSTPGVEWCEHLPRSARMAHHVAVVRSLSMTGRGIGDHHADTFYILTGQKPDRSFFVDGINRKPHADDWPFIGSTVSWARKQDRELPGVVQLPALSGEVTGYINPGQFSGRLGPEHEPFLVRGDLDKPRDLVVPMLQRPAEINLGRLDSRQTLLQQIDSLPPHPLFATKSLETFEQYQRKAYSLLTSEKSHTAFDITQEPEQVRARYGNDINGQSVLLARRLVEAGVPFVGVHWIGRRVGAGLSWDTHSDNFGQLKNVLLPAFDACFASLLEDLSDRGLLDETIVVVVGEMGRTPKIGDPRTGGKGPPGRDHWIHCLPALLAGGGIAGGQIYGSSDAVAAYPADRPCSPEDLAATVYRAMGITESDLMWLDRVGRPQSLLAEGEPLPLFG